MAVSDLPRPNIYVATCLRTGRGKNAEDNEENAVHIMAVELAI